MLLAHTVSSSLSRKCTLAASKGETVAPITREKKQKRSEKWKMEEPMGEGRLWRRWHYNKSNRTMRCHSRCLERRGLQRENELRSLFCVIFDSAGICDRCWLLSMALCVFVCRSKWLLSGTDDCNLHNGLTLHTDTYRQDEEEAKKKKSQGFSIKDYRNVSALFGKSDSQI